VTNADASSHLLLPVLPLTDLSLFPEASLTVVTSRPGVVKAVEIAARSGGRVVTLALRDPSRADSSPRNLHPLGTLARVTEDLRLPDGSRRVEVDGLKRVRALDFIGTEVLIAEIELLEEGDAGDEWGPAVEALARYLHSHAELRAFLEGQRRSAEAMSWVNLACQHLPIAATARQKLLECDALERCLKISKGLDALLRKESLT
jgi:ATP-dependent Lon protease